MFLDYSEVKKVYLSTLQTNPEGHGRIEAAFYASVKFAFLKGVEVSDERVPVLVEALREILEVLANPPHEGDELVAATSAMARAYALVQAYSLPEDANASAG